jgi:hypothetical protein
LQPHHSCIAAASRRGSCQSTHLYRCGQKPSMSAHCLVPCECVQGAAILEIFGELHQRIRSSAKVGRPFRTLVTASQARASATVCKPLPDHPQLARPVRYALSSAGEAQRAQWWCARTSLDRGCRGEYRCRRWRRQPVMHCVLAQHICRLLLRPIVAAAAGRGGRMRTRLASRARELLLARRGLHERRRPPARRRLRQAPARACRPIRGAF